jgi:hypothetical protein
MAAVTKEQQLADIDHCAARIAGPRWTQRPAHPELSLAEQLLLVVHSRNGDGHRGLKPVDIQALVNLARQAQDVIDGQPVE